jgi:hypothetical protein
VFPKLSYTSTLLAALLAASLVGCPKSPSEPPQNQEPDGGRQNQVPDAGSAPDAGASSQSTKNNLKFKGGDRFSNDLASGLSLEKETLCKELGFYDCAAIAHKITLGGTEPYVQTIYTPISERTVSSSNAVERIALSACSKRSTLDFAKAAEAVVFQELVTSAAAPTNAALTAVVSRLYQRLLGREATTEETARLVEFYNELKAAEKEPARAFATYACFAVATSEESLFY